MGKGPCASLELARTLEVCVSFRIVYSRVFRHMNTRMRTNVCQRFKTEVDGLEPTHARFIGASGTHLGADGALVRWGK